MRITALILVMIHVTLAYVRIVFGCQMKNLMVQIVSKFVVWLHASNITKNLANQRELIFLRNASHCSSVKRAQLRLNENKQKYSAICLRTQKYLCKNNIIIVLKMIASGANNEAINGMLWFKCPKTKFCGARKVTIAVCETIALFNTGAASKAIVMDILQ